jgi:hypothetical protein
MKIIITVLISFFSFFSFSCKKPKDVSENIKQKYSHEESLEKLVKRINFNENKVNKAKQLIVNNKIFVFDLWEPVTYQGVIDWDNNPYENRSWYLYLQSLRMIGYLAEDYKYTSDYDNVEKTKEIIYSWYNRYSDDLKGSKLNKDVWNDHAVANRTLNLLHVFFMFEDEKDLREKILEILKFHGEWLFNDSNYTTGNHAVMIDRALFQLSSLFEFNESTSWRNKSIHRLEGIFEKEVTSEGVCTENSTSYHLYVLDLFLEITNLFNAYGINYKKEWDNKIFLMKEFANTVLKPDNTLPIIGDTYYSNYGKNLFETYSNEFLIYNASKGNKGKQFAPKNHSSIFPKSGYFIFKESFNEKVSNIDFENRTYLSFINTNLSPVHKHNDFLSITLSSLNEDLITDTGHLGYENNDITKFTRSTFAHSGITINEKELNFKEIDSKDVLIEDYHIEERYSMVIASLKVEKIKLKRSIYVVNPNLFIFYDNLISKEKIDNLNLNQIFNLGKNFKSYESNGNDLILNFEKNNLTVKQMLGNTTYKLINSDIENSKFIGMNTEGYNKPINGSSILYTSVPLNSRNKVEALTIVEVENKNYSSKKYNLIKTDLSFQFYLEDVLLFEIER